MHRAEAPERRPRKGDPVEEVGTLPLRAAVGNRPRGLQRGRERLGLLHARPVALADVPLGRGRHRRALGRQAASLLRPRDVEREGPDPQGATLRPHEQRGEPRRGRQGVLLLRRLDADALVHEVPLQVPAGGVPVPRPPRDEPRAIARGDGVRAARHRRVPRGPVLRRLPRGRQGRPRGPPDPRLRPQPGPGTGAARSPPDAVVPEHVVVGRRRRQAAPRGIGAGKDPRGSFRDGHVRARVRREPGAPLHGEREQRRTSLGPAEPDPVREGRVPPVRRRRRDGRGESREGGHQGRGPVRPRRAGGRVRRRPAPPRGGAPGRPVRSGVRLDLRGPSRRRGRVLREDHAAFADRGRTPGPPAGSRGDALVQAVLLLRRGPLARRARRAPAPREPDGDPERRVVPHVQRRRHLDARQVGVPLVRGVGPRVSHDLPLARRLRLRQAAAPPDAQEPLRASERADPGVRVELLRREPARSTPGRRTSSTRSSATSAAPTSSSSSARSRGCSSTSTGG